MRKTSLAEAKVHLSELVDAAEHCGKWILILRSGRPFAAIVPVPVDVAAAAPPAVGRMTAGEAARFLDRLAALGDPAFDAVGDLISGRR